MRKRTGTYRPGNEKDGFEDWDGFPESTPGSGRDPRHIASGGMNARCTSSSEKRGFPHDTADRQRDSWGFEEEESDGAYTGRTPASSGRRSPLHGTSGGQRDNWSFEDDIADGAYTGRTPASSGRRGLSHGTSGGQRDSWAFEDEQLYGVSFDPPSSPPKKRRKAGSFAFFAAAACVLIAAGFLLFAHGRSSQAPVPTAAVQTPAPPTPAAYTPQPVRSSAPPTAVPTPSSPTPGPVPSPTPAPITPPDVTISGYAYDDPIYYFRAGLSAEDAGLYDLICAALENGAEQAVGIPTDDSDRVFRVLECVCYDHPEYFWIRDGGQYSTTNTGGGPVGTLSFKVLADESERAAVSRRLNDVTESLKRSVGSATDYEKALAVYEYVIDNTIYDMNYNTQSLLDVVRHGRGVCAGYTTYAQYLLQQLGIPAIRVTGNADGDSHAWNIIRLDGDWYQFDATWGDPTDVSYGGDPNQTKSFKYFCLTDREMYLDHEPDPAYTYPVCTATACNYYVHEGRWTTRYDENWLLSLIKKDLAAGREKTEFRAATQEVYNEYQKRLIDDGRYSNLIQQVRGGDGSFSWSAEEDLFLLQFYF